MVPAPAQVATPPYDPDAAFSIADQTFARWPMLTMIFVLVLATIGISWLVLRVAWWDRDRMDARDKAIRDDERNRRG